MHGANGGPKPVRIARNRQGTGVVWSPARLPGPFRVPSTCSWTGRSAGCSYSGTLFSILVQVRHTPDTSSVLLACNCLLKQQTPSKEQAVRTLAVSEHSPAGEVPGRPQLSGPQQGQAALTSLSNSSAGRSVGRGREDAFDRTLHLGTFCAWRWSTLPAQSRGIIRCTPGDGSRCQSRLPLFVLHGIPGKDVLA